MELQDLQRDRRPPQTRTRPKEGTLDAFVPRWQRQRVRRALPVLLGISVVFALCAGVYRYYKPLPYKSSVQVEAVGYVSADPGPNVMTRQVPAVASVYHAASSTEVIEHLTDSFNLVAHYGLKADDPFARPRAMERLAASIEPRFLDGQVILITVKDKDRAMAQALADAIPHRLDRLARQMESLIMEQNAAVLEKAIQRSNDESARRAEALMDMLATKLRAGNGDGEEDRIRETMSALLMLSAPNFDVERMLYITDELLKHPALPRIKVVRSALPDLHRSHRMDIAAMVGISGAVSFLVMLTSLLGWYAAQQESILRAE